MEREPVHKTHYSDEKGFVYCGKYSARREENEDEEEICISGPGVNKRRRRHRNEIKQKKKQKKAAGKIKNFNQQIKKKMIRKREKQPDSEGSRRFLQIFSRGGENNGGKAWKAIKKNFFFSLSLSAGNSGRFSFRGAVIPGLNFISLISPVTRLTVPGGAGKSAATTADQEIPDNKKQLRVGKSEQPVGSPPDVRIENLETRLTLTKVFDWTHSSLKWVNSAIN